MDVDEDEEDDELNMDDSDDDDDNDNEAIDWISELAQSPAALLDAIANGYASALWTEENGWEDECGVMGCKEAAGTTAIACSFCAHIYHNVPQCIGADNIAPAESLAEGDDVHWACPGCWKETRRNAERKLLQPAPQRKRKRRKRTQRAAASGGHGR